MIAIAVVSQKGGVGKTITVANLGAAFAARSGGCCWSTSIPRQTCRPAGASRTTTRARGSSPSSSRRVDVRDALVRSPSARRARLALLPTAYEALRRQTARLLAGDHGELARLLAQVEGGSTSR